MEKLKLRIAMNRKILELAAKEFLTWHNEIGPKTGLGCHEAMKAILFNMREKGRALEVVLEINYRGRFRKSLMDYSDPDSIIEIDDGPNIKSCTKLAQSESTQRKKIFWILINPTGKAKLIKQIRLFEIENVMIIKTGNNCKGWKWYEQNKKI
jgi:hypothetical protein